MASKMVENAKMESCLSSVTAYVEGGIQDVFDDSCSICLEAFCKNNPSTLTCCKHEFHLQCILEWCQRSSQCPMCWQPISLKDPNGEQLFKAVERERTIRSNQSRRGTTIIHPSLGDFELPFVPNGSELEERVFQRLAAAAAQMGREIEFSRSDGSHDELGLNGQPQLLLLSRNADMADAAFPSSSTVGSGENVQCAGITLPGEVVLPTVRNSTPRVIAIPVHQIDSNSPSSGSSVGSTMIFANRPSAGKKTPVNQDRAGPSDMHSFSESLKTRLNAVSTRYKESITKSTRGWKEKLFSRHSSVAEIGSEVRREVNAGIASVSRLVERLETRGNRRTTGSSPSPESNGGRVVSGTATNPPNSGNLLDLTISASRSN